MFARPTVRHVEPEIRPLIHPGGAASIGDGDCMAHSEVHSLHDPLPLQFPAVADGHGGHVAAGADELLAVVVTLLHVLKTSPDGQTELLWDLKSPEILRGGDQSDRFNYYLLNTPSQTLSEAIHLLHAGKTHVGSIASWSRLRSAVGSKSTITSMISTLLK